MSLVTCIAPVNIAVIKYWGKRDESLIIPLNDSLSATLSTDVMHAKTSILASATLKENKLWLNGKEESFDNARLLSCLKEIKKRATEQSTVTSDLLSWNLHICSENNFPTAAGLASSAAGYACLVATLAKLYKIDGEISSIARLGSGSACRSVYGGFVQWHAGIKDDGTDSIASQVAPADHWPQMRILIIVVSDKKKKTSSTNGMRNSAATSDLLKLRIEKCVPERTAAIKEAILKKDFEKFAEITMKDSNQFHAICLDTFPPCVYMNEVSHAIVDMVHKYNAACGSNKIAYTFDAGPNACLYMLKEQIPFALSLIKETFPTDLNKDVEFLKGIAVDLKPLPENIRLSVDKQDVNLLQYLIHTKVGEGPQQLVDANSHLLDIAGAPKFA